MGGLLHGALFFAALYAQIFLLGFQSRNVNSGQYAWAAITSICIAVTQVITVRAMAGFPPVEALSISVVAGPAGIVTAMRMHRHMTK